MWKSIVVFTVVFAAGFVAGTLWNPLLHHAAVRSRDVLFSGPHTFTLRGRVTCPRSFIPRRYPAILFCHGLLHEGANTRIYMLLEEELARKGHLVFSFTMRGFGDSSSVARFRIPEDLDFIADVKAALSHMVEKLPVDRSSVTIVGHSMGANLAFAAGVEDDRVRNIVAISAGNFAPPEKLVGSRREIFKKKFANILGAELPDKYFNRVEAPLDMFHYLPLPPGKRVLIVLADGDWPDVKKYNELLFDTLDCDKELLILSDSNHNLGADYYTGNTIIDQRPVRALAGAIDAWLDKSGHRGH